MYKRFVFDHISFPVGKIYEDLAVAFKEILLCKKVVYGDARLYFYLQRENSTMNESFNIKQYDEINIVDSATEEVLELYPDFDKEVVYRRACSYFAVLYRILSCNDKNGFVNERKEIVSKLMKYRSILLRGWNKDKSMKVKLVALSVGQYPYYICQKIISNLKKKAILRIK